MSRCRERLTPGIPLRFASALPLAGYGRGVIVTAVEGRPIKIDGNPRHPASLGATDVFAEADGAVALRSGSLARHRAPATGCNLECVRGRVAPRLDKGAARAGRRPCASHRPHDIADAGRQIDDADARRCRKRNGIATSRSTMTPCATARCWRSDAPDGRCRASAMPACR